MNNTFTLKTFNDKMILSKKKKIYLDTITFSISVSLYIDNLMKYCNQTSNKLENNHR